MKLFNHPFSCIINGVSNSGKSFLAAQLIKNRTKYINGEFDKIIYCAKYYTSFPEILKKDKIISFHSSIPSEQIFLNQSNENVLIVIDDLSQEIFESPDVANCFVQGRHRNISLIVMTHALFPKQKNARLCSLNASHIIIFRNLRDCQQIQHLARQICPSDSKSFTKMYLNCCAKPFSHLMLSFGQNIHNLFRYRTNILSDHAEIICDEDELAQYNLETDEKNREIQRITFAI